MKKLRGLIRPPLLLIALLGAVAGTSLIGTLTGQAVFWVSAAGAAVAVVCAVVGQRIRLLTAEWVALSAAGFFLVGGWIASSTGRPDFVGFFDSLVYGWAGLLSSIPPVEADTSYRVLPFALAWLAATGGLALARVTRVPALGALWPLSVFGLGLLFSVEVRTTALVQGGLMTAGSLTLGWFQQRDFGFESDLSLGSTTVAKKRTRVAQAGFVLVAVSFAAPFIAPLVPGFEGRERFDLRDRLEPPWNPLDEPSPLASLKGNYLDENRGQIVFVVHGEEVPQRWRLASLGVFDGSVWTVGDTSVGGQAHFVPVDAMLPPDPQVMATIDGPTLGSYELEVVDLDAPWMPMPESAVRLTVEPGADVRYNAVTRTAALPTGATNLRYVVEAELKDEPSDLELREATFPFPQGLGLSKQAAAVRNWAADLVQGDDRGWHQVEAVRDDLVDNGAYLASDVVRPGHSWKRLADFFSGELVYGFEEQYAAAAAVATRNADLPARVVVGYLIESAKLNESPVVVTRGEASAWIEVLTVEQGWVPVDVTPDRDTEPTLEQGGFRTETVAAPNPPPPPPPPSDVEIEPQELAVADKPPEEVLDEVLGGWSAPPAVLLGTVAAVPFAVAGLIGGGVVGAKAQRRRKRRRASTSSERVAGAWYETNDRLAEAGIGIRVDESVSERARLSGPQDGACEAVEELAVVVDHAAFGPREPTPAEADRAWRLYEQASDDMNRETGWIERVFRATNPTPLRSVRSRK